MLRWLALVVALGACSYKLELPRCKVTCMGPADCPADSTCRNGFCQQGSNDECATGTGGATGGTVGTGGVTATGGSTGTGGAPATGGAPGTGGAPATGGAPGTGGSPPPPPPDAAMPPPMPDAAPSAGCAGGCGMGTICCMAPWGCAGFCIPDCRPTGTCQANDVCNMMTGLCQPDCRKTNGNCPPGSGLTCNTTNGVCR
jgi:hypothetical protein